MHRTRTPEVMTLANKNEVAPPKTHEGMVRIHAQNLAMMPAHSSQNAAA